jgi:hypothetical protein
LGPWPWQTQPNDKEAGIDAESVGNDDDGLKSGFQLPILEQVDGGPVKSGDLS